MPEPTQNLCSFCGKNHEDVAVLIAGCGGDVFICDECVRLSEPIVFEHRVLRAALAMMAKAPATTVLSLKAKGSALDG